MSINLCLPIFVAFLLTAGEPAMKLADPSRSGAMFAKDPAVVRFGGRYLMYYSMSPSTDPAVPPGWGVGIAESRNGIAWTRWSHKPLLANGAPGEWNSSESGHPGIFEDDDGRTYLFFQGNNDNGKTWYLSAVELGWNDKGPFVKKDSGHCT
jgi:sucrose-6-phosphate hydrolase SacC (GH32 family)